MQIRCSTTGVHRYRLAACRLPQSCSLQDEWLLPSCRQPSPKRIRVFSGGSVQRERRCGNLDYTIRVGLVSAFGWCAGHGQIHDVGRRKIWLYATEHEVGEVDCGAEWRQFEAKFALCLCHGVQIAVLCEVSRFTNRTAQPVCSMFFFFFFFLPVWWVYFGDAVCAMLQAVTRRSLIPAAWVWSQASPAGICGGLSDTVTGFSTGFSVSPVSIVSPCSVLIQPLRRRYVIVAPLDKRRRRRVRVTPRDWMMGE